MKNLKKSRLWSGICLVILVLLGSQLISCSAKPQKESAESEVSEMSELSSEESAGSMQTAEAESSQLPTAPESSSAETFQDAEHAQKIELNIAPGSCLKDILKQLIENGWGQSVEELLEEIDQIEQTKPEEFHYWSEIENPKKRAFSAEGYIAPGTYCLEDSMTAQEVLEKLLHSWDELLSDEMEQQAAEQGYTMDQVLIMASIVEWESSYDPKNIVKPQVASVVRNRVEMPTALQMDVTIFYLQQSLEPYRNPEDYEAFYDTYITADLPAGPIGSPSLDSIEAVLAPAGGQDLFFVYDEAGNYYFAEDYETHLSNCQLAGIE